MFKRALRVVVLLSMAACSKQVDHVDASLDEAVAPDDQGSAIDLTTQGDSALPVHDEGVDASKGGAPTLPAEVVAAGCTNSIFFDDFDDLHTIDVKNTKAAGFNWYVYNATTTNVTPPGNITQKNIGATSVVRLDPAGAGLLGNTVNASGPVGPTFNVRNGKCLYAESRMAMGLVSMTASGWPAFWLESSKHLDNIHMPWAGNPNPYYIHYVEIDIMELASKYSLNARSTMIDWYGQFKTSTTDCPDPSPDYCKVEDGQGLGPDIAGTYDSTDAAPVFHRFGALWIPSVPKSGSKTYTQGSMQWFYEGKPIGKVVTWTGPPSTTTYVPMAPWTYSLADQEDVSLSVNTGGNVFTDVDYVGVWQAP